MHQMCILTTQVSSVMLKSKKLEIRKKMWKLKDQSDGNQTECHEIEPNLSKDRATYTHEKDNPLFEMNLQYLLFLLTVQFIFAF